MKKKIVAAMIAVVAALSITACGNTGANQPAETQESVDLNVLPSNGMPDLVNVPLKDLDVDQYVTLPDYNNIGYEMPTVSKEEVESQLLQTYLMVFPEEKRVTDRELKKGDTANIDYVGTLDGVVFEGGTAEGYNLTLGSKSFIDGFEDGLIGVMPGETVDLNLTFPENYSEPLAGKEVVFTVTVNYLIPKELDDSVVAGLGIEGIDTIAALRKMIEQSANESLRSQAETGVLEAVLMQCEFKDFPSMLIEKYKGDIEKNIEETAQAYGMDGETYAQQAYGVDLQTLVNTYGLQNLQMNVACQAIANRENLNVSDSMLKDQINAAAATYGISAEEYLGDNTEEEFREYLMYTNVLKYLASKNIK